MTRILTKILGLESMLEHATVLKLLAKVCRLFRSHKTRKINHYNYD